MELTGTGKAVLVKHKGEVGQINPAVPLGKVYNVILESASIARYQNVETLEFVDVPRIMAQNDDGSWGWLPLSVLKLEDNERAN